MSNEVTAIDKLRGTVTNAMETSYVNGKETGVTLLATALVKRINAKGKNSLSYEEIMEIRGEVVDEISNSDFFKTGTTIR
jgi:hypothetical protein